MEKGYYADGEDAYDMRLPFAQNGSSSSIKPMTPLKQVVAVNSAAVAKRKEEAPKVSTAVAAAREEGKPSGEAGSGSGIGSGGSGAGGGSSAIKGEDEASEGVETVSKQLEGLSVDGDKA